jgi:N-methylhydantoinase B
MRLRLELPDGSKRHLNSKGAFIVPPDGRIVMEAPGSGSYGPPSARDPALLREDLADGYVTEAAARGEYELNFDV